MRCILLVLLGGCDGVDKLGLADGPCQTSTYGYTIPSEAAQAALEQTNCYRNLMGLSRGRLDPDLDEAAQAHADYMATLGAITHQESVSEPGFSGEWIDERVEAAGYPLEDGDMISEIVAWGHTPTLAVDAWMATVYHRIPFTLATWRDLGFGQTGDYSSMSFVSPFPDGKHAAVIFPADGQVDVPIDFDSDTESPDPAPDHGVVGYPITVTVSADATYGSDGSNPYDLKLIDAALWGPGGDELEILILDPTTDELIFVMAAMVPIEPLEPDASYIAEITVSWADATETLVTEFQTASPPAE
jgi:hypothetical protein